MSLAIARVDSRKIRGFSPVSSTFRALRIREGRVSQSPRPSAAAISRVSPRPLGRHLNCPFPNRNARYEQPASPRRDGSPVVGRVPSRRAPRGVVDGLSLFYKI